MHPTKMIFLASLIFFCSLAQAEPASKHFYIFLQAGQSTPFSSPDQTIISLTFAGFDNAAYQEVFSSKMDSSTVYGLGAGFLLPAPFLTTIIESSAIEIGVNSTQYQITGTRDESTLFNNIPITANVLSNYQYTLSNLSLLINYRLNFSLGRFISPFISAGIGATHYSLGQFNETVNTNAVYILKETMPDSSGINFAYDAALGIDFTLGSLQQTHFSLGYRYMNSGRVTTSTNGLIGADIPPVSVNRFSLDDAANEFYIQLTQYL